MLYSVLLIGQSNMAGRGFFTDVEPIVNEHIRTFRNCRWQPLFWPVCPDRAYAGVNLAESFADAFSKEHDGGLGLIACADGGTNIDQWEEGSILYQNAVFHANMAQKTSKLVAILWHQGESDCSDARHPVYEEKLKKLMAALRRDLNLPDVPFIIGGLGDYLKDYPDGSMVNYTIINDIFKKLAAEDPRIGFASAEGLTSNGDNLHFNAKSLREFGLRYYEVFRAMEDKTKVYEEKVEIDDTQRSALEAL